MTRLLRRAFEEASKLPDDEQNALARLLLEEIYSEEGWASIFAETKDLLSELADEALAEHRANRTEPLDPNDL
jgi:hypothetical protein